jgi:hypothetical protein
LAEIFLYRCTIAQIAYLQTMRKQLVKKNGGRASSPLPPSAVRRPPPAAAG